MPRNYEALLIFAGNVNEDSLDKAIERANGDIEKLGGKIESVENLGRKQFARVMGKCESGVY
ncbi:MAG: 30S ribosomal protein S6, partial [Kiritimatiellae bacterium]|nr:30S ribosomal protein S6 [Kiritimatiellia bacterium]